MRNNLAYKYLLRPTNSQKKHLNQCFALQRRAWNHLLATTNDLPKDMKLGEKLKVWRKAYREYMNLEENKWMLDVVSNHRYTAYVEKNFAAGWKRFFDALKKGDVSKAQAKYRANYELKKHTGIKWNQKRFESFYKPKFKPFFDNQSFETDGKGAAKIDLENGLVWLHEKLEPIRFKIKKDDKIYGENITKIGKLTFSKDKAGRHYLSVAFEVKEKVVQMDDLKKGVHLDTVGVDMGCTDYAVLSSGLSVNIRTTERIDCKIKQLQLHLSRQKLKGKNWQKTKCKIAKLHAKKANIRKYDTHQFTTALVKSYDLIGIEDLNVSGMTGKSNAKLGEDGKTFVRNNKRQKAGLNRSVLSKNFYETRRQLEYKSDWYGKRTEVIPRYFPSSKTCSACGHKLSKEELTLDVREWACPKCATVHQRDHNAGKNIEQQAIIQFIQAEVNAPGTMPTIKSRKVSDNDRVEDAPVQNACPSSQEDTRKKSSLKGCNHTINDRRLATNQTGEIQFLKLLNDSPLRIEKIRDVVATG